MLTTLSRKKRNLIRVIYKLQQDLLAQIFLVLPDDPKKNCMRICGNSLDKTINSQNSSAGE
ncbi:MAG: hypothetical protein KME32_27240 [Mojavia pulchra JT2-VF2]|uniref:Uncharacterized protein n=1 Tax=Mojavia pulchra JT2-VF2 TaxID=287848 RepID=A0A951UIK5_9NOST|nr:hypothetical protein [Mojavia pulchra JT2-VF2]